jgi:ligand-binding sensor domain-containing protein
MSNNLIVPWTGESRTDLITRWEEQQVLEPEPIYPGWVNFVSQRSIRAIAISPKSRHMWMATWGGVLSWRQRDETTYFRYSSEHGLLGNGAACICIEQEERPWVGHQEGGLGYFENSRWNVYPELKAERFRVVTKAEQGGIWAATNNCIYRIPGPQHGSVPELVNNAAAQYPLTLLTDGNELLLGNNQGLFRLVNGELLNVEAQLIKACTSLSRDAQDRIWIGTANEIYLMEGRKVHPDPFYDGRAGYVRQLAAGRDLVWILTTEGISVVDNDWKPVSFNWELPVTPQTIAVSLSDRHLWVGTSSLLSSLYYSNDGNATWEHERQLLPHREDGLSNLVRCIAGSETAGHTWIGTAGGLVTFRPDDTWDVDALAGAVRDLCVTAKDTLWLLRWPKGFEALNVTFDQPPGIPIALAKGSDGNAYGLTSRGLWLLGPNSKLISAVPPTRALCISQTQDGTWWAGTTEGVYRYINGAWSAANEQPGPGLSEVYSLIAHGKKLWAAAANGLWRRTGNTWESHNDAQPRIVRAIAVAGDENKLWLAETDAVVRYSPDTKTIDRSYSVENHGIGSRRVEALAEIRGDLWIATAAGLSRLRLNEEVI